MAATVTVTGKVGPGSTITAQVFSNVSAFSIDCIANVISIIINDLVSNIGITSANTITATKSGSTYTLTIS